MNDDELSRWPTKAAAAAQLKMSVRSLERLIADGEIESQLRAAAEPGQRAERVCNPADLNKFMPAAFVVPARTPALPATAPELSGRTAPQPLDALAAWFQSIARLSQAFPPQERTQARWMTYSEAEKYSGIPARTLKRAARQKLITTIGRGDACRIDRNSLDAFPGFPPANSAPKS